MNRLRRVRRLIALPLLAAALAPCVARAVEEAELKAAIVINILLFVEWPAAAPPEQGGALRLCVGPNSSLREAFKPLDRREVRGRVLELRELAPGDDGRRPCHAVFIDAADRTRLAATLRAQRAAGALVLSDDPDAPRDSTAIVLERVGNKIAFDVNLQPVRHARLQLSSKLLRLARVVRE
ncbi:MAG TPA: YfiR family protein [Albitalea sp.]